MSDVASSHFETSEGADEGSQLALVLLSEFPAPQGEIGPWLGSGVEWAIYLQSMGWFPVAVAFVDKANTSWRGAGGSQAGGAARDPNGRPFAAAFWAFDVLEGISGVAGDGA